MPYPPNYVPPNPDQIARLIFFSLLALALVVGIILQRYVLPL